ncbi:MAG: Rrf2 family transcriptional regulator [Bacteroidetes bacterium]|nr:Rrf2 family transcriptional regulator [Bacteroidota bacterium]MBU1718972.1 Rrf2 family transcriptional regulator [Bacteroidota bacterium]
MLSKKAQYSLYALIRLAKEYDKGPVLIEDIARSEMLPKKFLEAILSDLKSLGIVNAKKGKGGGYYLIKDPAEITLAEVIRHFDGALALLPCVTFRYYESCNHCKDEETCGLRSIIKELRDETVKILKRNTLADILSRENALEKG